MTRADSNTQQAEQVAQVRALSREIESAISAIEKNDVDRFAAHIAAQEAICNRLMLPPAPAAHSSDPASQVFKEMQKAYADLAQLNKVYAAVLKRAERTTGLIANIYRAYRQGYDRKPSPAAKHQTWSCEV